ncbi:hypothetical protein KIF53_08775 [Chromobacterium subtsugae]|uniref:Uncharacterized protein n=1 Tax=Chromobacterium subtsugae TaxID=251747 RepID=A0ABS7FCB0_9NEIS|nr:MULTISPECIES: hypothetical protein [Chromobacterium]MBW7566422.1 hypothetical protein [Chromobacterium subtsugae]MBW8287719.1 hypothetical protein [Chromobacterium subtsugae]WSE91051.1 hypothetical protein U6115_19560 [Chromobacterium subtsugae]WVH59425.1 hypothetical protein U6151_19590 [Chromobacterium subtsugae]
MSTQELNLTSELARLLYYAAHVATTIRQRSEKIDSRGCRLLNGKGIFQLADALHNFDLLGHAVLTNNPRAMLRVCNLLLKDYQRYIQRYAIPLDDTKTSGFGKPGIHMVDLQEGVKIITEIQTRVRLLTKAACVS